MNISNRDTKFNDANLPFLFRKVRDRPCHANSEN